MPDKLCFEVTACGGKWVVSVDGTMVLACKDKKTALAAMRAATKLMVRSGDARCACAAATGVSASEPSESESPPMAKSA